MGKPKPPEPPNPRETSAASTSTNIGTAIANAWLQNPNQITPEGRLTQRWTGNREWRDPFTNRTYNIPTFTVTQKYSPAQQKIFNAQNKANLELSRTAANQSEFLKNYLGKPVDLTNEAIEARLFDLGSRRLRPEIERQRGDLASRLANQGIKAGSRAYDREMSLQGQSENDAWTQLMLRGRGQSVDEILTARNQPINEIGALLGTGQVQQPRFQNPNIGAIPTTDVAGIINQDFQNRQNQYNQRLAQRNSILGGLFGLGSSLIGLSDERAKKDKEKIGKLGGHNVYEYRYKGEEGPKRVGVMAQEVEKKRPDAVIKGPRGMKHVNYGALYGM